VIIADYRSVTEASWTAVRVGAMIKGSTDIRPFRVSTKGN